jgi:hypothetical protein
MTKAEHRVPALHAHRPTNGDACDRNSVCRADRPEARRKPISWRVWLKPILIGGLLLLSAVALAAPPAGSDPASELAKWFHSLKSNEGEPCCDIADCRLVESKVVNSGFQVFIDEEWVPVPQYVILSVTNPNKKAVACYHYSEAENKGLLILCFVPISMS